VVDEFADTTTSLRRVPAAERQTSPALEAFHRPNTVPARKLDATHRPISTPVVRFVLPRWLCRRRKYRHQPQASSFALPLSEFGPLEGRESGSRRPPATASPSLETPGHSLQRASDELRGPTHSDSNSVDCSGVRCAWSSPLRPTPLPGTQRLDKPQTSGV
jgi:hypothetical protein